LVEPDDRHCDVCVPAGEPSRELREELRGTIEPGCVSAAWRKRSSTRQRRLRGGPLTTSRV
jgi:hypothetical protein